MSDAEEIERPYNRCIDVAIGLVIFSRYGAKGPEAEHDVIHCGQPYDVAIAREDSEALIAHGWHHSATCDCGVITNEIEESGDYESVERDHAATCNDWEFFT
jgi:hypothetical protein